MDAKSKGAVIILPGFNDKTIIEMGDLGFLKGKAQNIYLKMKRIIK